MGEVEEGAGLEAPPPGWLLLPGPCVLATCPLFAVIADVTSLFLFWVPHEASPIKKAHV